MLHFESTGEGPAVLLIMGLGLPGDAWWRTVPVLARSLRVVTFDNRGCGTRRASGRPADARGDGRGCRLRARRGGDRARTRVRDLDGRDDRPGTRAAIPGARRFARARRDLRGRRAATPPDRETLAFLARRATVPDEEGRWASVPYVYSERTRGSGGQRIGEDFARRRAYRFDPVGYGAQLAAAAAHDAAARLGDIAAPTLVVHGAEDRMVPPANGRALAASDRGFAPARARRRGAPVHHRRARGRRGGARVPDSVSRRRRRSGRPRRRPPAPRSCRGGPCPRAGGAGRRGGGSRSDGRWPRARRGRPRRGRRARAP